MKQMRLLAALLVLSAAPAHVAAQGYAVFSPGQLSAAAAADSPAPGRIVARARQALARPPGAIPRLHTEGTLPGKGIREISLKAKEDQPIVLDLALAWRLTGERPFLAQTERYLVAWADIYQMSFNPIDETGFDALLLATDLAGPDLSPQARAKLGVFWRRMAEGYLREMKAKPRNFNTNWQSHRVKLASMAAFETGDPTLIDAAAAAYRAQVQANITSDGSVFDFHERDALHYVTYDLDPLLMAALAAKAHGQDWYGWAAPGGGSLPRALDWLEPYALGAKTHIEFARSKIQFDRDRAAAGQSEYAPHPWNRANAVGTFALASLLDPRRRRTLEAVTAETGRRPADWIALKLATER